MSNTQKQSELSASLLRMQNLKVLLFSISCIALMSGIPFVLRAHLSFTMFSLCRPNYVS